jgi:hypothetical protein
MPFEPSLFLASKNDYTKRVKLQKTSQIINTNFKEDRSVILANAHDISALLASVHLRNGE